MNETTNDFIYKGAWRLVFNSLKVFKRDLQLEEEENGSVEIEATAKGTWANEDTEKTQKQVQLGKW